MTECKEISDLLIEYINRKLTQEQNSMVVSHLAICQSCRNEMAVLFKIKKSEQTKWVDVPQNIMNSAFKKVIPKDKSTIEDIFSSDSYFMAFVLIRYSLNIIKQTIQLAQQVLKEVNQLCQMKSLYKNYVSYWIAYPTRYPSFLRE